MTHTKKNMQLFRIFMYKFITFFHIRNVYRLTWEADKFKAWVQGANQMSIILQLYTSSMKQYRLVYIEKLL